MRFVLLAAIAVPTLSGCIDSRSPLAQPPETQVNFFEGSEALVRSPSGGSFIYVDRVDTTRDVPPFFAGDQYPIDATDAGKPYERVMYMRMPQGAHRYWFMDGHHAALTDTAFALVGGESRVLCLIDSLGLWYRVLNIDESTTGSPGQMRIRVLNLSPDAGTLNVYAVGDTGQAIPSDLPQGTSFPTATSYVTVDSSLVSNDGNVYLDFFAGADTAFHVVSATVPFERGRSYEVVIVGYAQSETTQYPDPVHPGQFTTAVFGPTIRSVVRATE